MAKFERAALEATKVSELRLMVTREKIGTPNWRRNAPKAQLIAGLMGEEIDLSSETALTGEAGHQLIESLLALTSNQKGSVDIDEVRDVVREEIASAKDTFTRRIEVLRPDGAAHKIEGHVHCQFETMLKYIAAGVHVWLTGPAGSGKTHAAEQAAEALGLPFYCQSVGAQTPMSSLLGYMDATGSYRGTVFRQAYERGGVFLLDEIDAGNPNILTALNAALSNGVCSFPDGMVRKHAGFVCVAAANTYGNGQNRQYVGRNQLDATTLNRFAVLDWMYDEQLEAALCPLPEWTRFVQAVRAAVGSLGIQHIVSPRASINGSKLLLAGVDAGQVVKSVIYQGLDSSAIARIESGLSGAGMDEAALRQQVAEALRQARQNSKPRHEAAEHDSPAHDADEAQEDAAA